MNWPRKCTEAWLPTSYNSVSNWVCIYIDRYLFVCWNDTVELMCRFIHVVLSKTSIVIIFPCGVYVILSAAAQVGVRLRTAAHTSLSRAPEMRPHKRNRKKYFNSPDGKHMRTSQRPHLVQKINKQLKCVVCNAKTTMCCSECSSDDVTVPLCVRQREPQFPSCFHKFHSQADL